jgi:hypothetical protein
LTVPVTKGLLNNPYRTINFVFIIIIVGVLLYSAIISPDDGHYPLSSNYKTITGEDTLSTGLSRSFSCIVRLRFEEARLYNEFSFRIFTFFIIQLLMRLIAATLTKNKSNKQRQSIIITDVIISCILFAFCFWPFIIETFRAN